MLRSIRKQLLTSNIRIFIHWSHLLLCVEYFLLNFFSSHLSPKGLVAVRWNLKCPCSNGLPVSSRAFLSCFLFARRFQGSLQLTRPTFTARSRLLPRQQLGRRKHGADPAAGSKDKERILSSSVSMKRCDAAAASALSWKRGKQHRPFW